MYANSDNVIETHDEDDEENEDEPTDGEEPVTDTEEEEDEGYRLFKIKSPNKWASSALNALIRVLIVRILPQQLHSFW